MVNLLGNSAFRVKQKEENVTGLETVLRRSREVKRASICISF